jgi:hypothetical protein
MPPEPTCPNQYQPSHFTGPALEQVKCLLRPVRPKGIVGGRLQTLPAPFEQLLGHPVGVGRDELRSFLTSRNIREADIGGPLSDPVTATHMVIHDTSTPNFKGQPFPANINTAQGSGNNLQAFAGGERTHVFINRVGESLTSRNFKAPTPKAGIKLENKFPALKKIFLHIECTQPRRSDPQGPVGNDMIAPTPGFPDTQLERLALVYVAGSVRRGQWLIPAYHCVLDIGIPNAHDDPQNFDLNQWASLLAALLAAIKAA